MCQNCSNGYIIKHNKSSFLHRAYIFHDVKKRINISDPRELFLKRPVCKMDLLLAFQDWDFGKNIPKTNKSGSLFLKCSCRHCGICAKCPFLLGVWNFCTWCEESAYVTSSKYTPLASSL